MKLQSLLDVILSSRSGDISVLNRVIYVATVESGKNTQDIEDYHRKLSTLSGFVDADAMRGILLHCSNDTILHLLEGPAMQVGNFLSQLQNDHQKPLVHNSVKVLLSTEDIDGYGFPIWACKPLNLPRPDGDMDRKDPIAPHVYKTYVNLLEMGKQLLAMGGGELSDALENLRSNFHEKLPGNELVGSFIKSVHTTPLDSFTEIFAEEVQVLEESEQSWPQPPPLQY